jgi:hypothetical protein
VTLLDRLFRWTREGQTPNLVGSDGTRWWWAPESWDYHVVARRAPRFATETEALTAALDWLDAGEPELREVAS